MVSCTNGATLHGNYHHLAAKLPNVSFFIKYIIENSFFYKQLDWTGVQNNFQQLVFFNLFADNITHPATGLELGRYVYAVWGNWDNNKPDDEVAASNKENDEEIKNMKEPLDNLYIFYGIYN